MKLINKTFKILLFIFGILFCINGFAITLDLKKVKFIIFKVSGEYRLVYFQYFIFNLVILNKLIQCLLKSFTQITFHGQKIHKIII